MTKHVVYSPANLFLDPSVFDEAYGRVLFLPKVWVDRPCITLLTKGGEPPASPPPTTHDEEDSVAYFEVHVMKFDQYEQNKIMGRDSQGCE